MSCAWTRQGAPAPVAVVSTTSKSWMIVAVLAIIADGELNLLRCKPSSLHHEMHVNAAKYFWILLCALSFKLDGDILDRLAALLKDMNYIVSRTAPQADQHQLHGTWPRSAPFRPERRSKHDLMPAPGLADERAVFNPFDACLHLGHPRWNDLSPPPSDERVRC